MVVTLGSDRWPFRRLVERLRSIIPDGVDVLWQTGPTPVDDLGIDAHRYVPAGELATAMAEADVVVSHGGCGSALMALRAGRVPVLVARDPLHGEVVDGHQRPFMHELAVQGLAVAREVDALSLDDLHDAASRSVRRRDDLPMLRLAR
jgi:UDP-N-acetylglucosamine transferase subunit ALG13